MPINMHASSQEIQFIAKKYGNPVKDLSKFFDKKFNYRTK
jgi:hypothetical protein